MTENLSLALVMLQLHNSAFMFKNCRAFLRIGNPGTRCLFTLGACTVLPETRIAIAIPFFYLKRSHFANLLCDNYQKFRVGTKGNYITNTSPVDTTKSKNTQNVWPTKLVFI